MSFACYNEQEDLYLQWTRKVFEQVNCVIHAPLVARKRVLEILTIFKQVSVGTSVPFFWTNSHHCLSQFYYVVPSKAAQSNRLQFLLVPLVAQKLHFTFMSHLKGLFTQK